MNSKYTVMIAAAIILIILTGFMTGFCIAHDRYFWAFINASLMSVNVVSLVSICGFRKLSK